MTRGQRQQNRAYTTHVDLIDMASAALTSDHVVAEEVTLGVFNDLVENLSLVLGREAINLDITHYFIPDGNRAVRYCALDALIRSCYDALGDCRVKLDISRYSGTIPNGQIRYSPRRLPRTGNFGMFRLHTDALGFWDIAAQIMVPGSPLYLAYLAGKYLRNHLVVRLEPAPTIAMYHRVK